MRTLLFSLLLLLVCSPALADYRVSPPTWVLERTSQTTACYWGYIQKGQTGALGAAGVVLAGAGSSTTTVTFPNNTSGTARIYEWGWCNAGTVSVSNPMNPKQWFKEVLSGSGENSMHGQVIGDKYYDSNGTEVNPETGEPINPDEAEARANIELPSLFPDRPTDYQIIMTDSGTGEFLGMVNATAFPGSSNGLTLTADRPFDFTYAPIIDGVADPGLGGSGSSSGGNSSNSGNPVTVPPNVSTNNPVVTPNTTPTAVSGTDTAAVKGAIDRLAGINLQGFNDNKVANGMMQGLLDDILNTLKGVKTAILGQGEAAEGITQAEVTDAVEDGMNGVLGQSRTNDTSASDAMQEAIDGKEGILDAITGIKSSMNGTIDSLGGLVSALNLDQTYGSESMVFTISLGPFGTHVLDLEDYAEVFDVIRLVTLFMIGISYAKKYFVLVRGALVG